MNIFKNKILVKIIASICIVLTISNVGMPNKVYADSYGGILLKPVTNLLTSIADGVIGLFHKTVQDQPITFVEISGAYKWWDNVGEKALAVFISVVLLAIGVVAVAVTGGAAIAAGTIPIKIALITAGAIVADVTLTVKTGDGVLERAGKFVAERATDAFADTLYMPVFSLTPRYIFSNKVWLFDINFFEPESEKEYYLTIDNSADLSGKNINAADSIQKVSAESFEGLFETLKGISTSTEITIDNNCDSSYPNLAKLILKTNEQLENVYRPTINFDGKYKVRVDEATDSTSGTMGTDTYSKNNKIKITLIEKSNSKEYISVEYVFTEKHQVLSQYSGNWKTNFYEDFDVTIINDIDIEQKQDELKIDSIATSLKGVVSKWYFILRNIAMLMLLMLLMYLGIRIVIGSTAGQKAKYKERLQDWLVAMCLLFIMQYIMVFATRLVEKFTELIVTLDVESGNVVIVPLKRNHIQNINEMQEEQTSPEYNALNSLGVVLDAPNGGKELAWITDIMGKFRIMSQATEEGTLNWLGYSMCYVLLVTFTVFFAWTYLKRVLYMAFLTILSPMVAMTYPLDKLNDGKAQAFSMWLKEYIFNLLIQPMHLLLYTALITAAYKLASTNPIYSIVAIGFITPAEALVRKFFGFNKAQTAGMISGAAGAALAYTGLQSAMKFAKGLTGGKSGKDDKGEKEPRFTSKNKVDEHKTLADNALKDDKGKLGGGNSGDNEGGFGGATEKDESAIRMNEEGNRGESPETFQKEDVPEAEKPKADEEKEDKSEESAEGKKPKDGEEKEDKPEESEEGEKTKDKKEILQEKLKRIKKGCKAGAKGYIRRLGSKWRRKIEKQRPIRALARGIAGISTGATLGAAGIVLGLASGDPSKALKYGSAATFGGYNLGKGLAGKAVDIASVDTKKLTEELELAYYGGDIDAYKEAKITEGVMKTANDQGNIWKLQQLLPDIDRDEIVAMMQGDFGRKCYENDITSMEDVAAVYKASQINNLETGKPQMSIDTAIAGLKFINYLPAKLKNMDEDDRAQMIKRWTREYAEMKAQDPEKYANLDPEKAANTSMSVAEDMDKIRSGLKDAKTKK